MLRAILFDFDGTLADTIPAITEGINLAMEQYGFPTHTEAEVLSYINNGPRKLITRALPKEHQGDESLIDRVLADYTALYDGIFLHTDRPYDGIFPVLHALRAEGYVIGVLSNKQDFLLRRFCDVVLPGLCDGVLGTFPGKPTKPDPQMTLQLTDALGVDPADCVLIGDSDVDIYTAKNAGMKHIGVTWGYRDAECLLANGATHLANTPSDLLSIINTIKQERT